MTTNTKAPMFWWDANDDGDLTLISEFVTLSHIRHIDLTESIEDFGHTTVMLAERHPLGGELTITKVGDIVNITIRQPGLVKLSVRVPYDESLTRCLKEMDEYLNRPSWVWHD